MKHPQKDGFTAAADKEYHELQEKNTFKVVDRPKDVQVIPLLVMWTFVYKYDTEGYLTKYKSRIVARGDLQRNGLHDTYAGKNVQSNDVHCGILWTRSGAMGH